MNKLAMIMSSLVLSAGFLITNVSSAETTRKVAVAPSCTEKVGKAVMSKAKVSEENCTSKVSFNPMGAGFGLVGEADIECGCPAVPGGFSCHHITVTKYSFHLAPGSSCKILSIAPISGAEPPAEAE